jgi:DNA anti-recombination protein RmuC
MAQVQAKQSFYHDLVGSRAINEVFEVNDQATLQTLEEQGYVKRVSGEMAQAFAQQKSLEQQMGQAQALTNEAVSLAQHAQNMEANNHTQQLAQEAQQRAEQKGASHMNQADHAAMQAKANAFEPTAEPAATTKAAAKKADK